MSYKNNTGDILAELDRIKQILEHYESLSLIPDIERDILLSGIRNIYEKLLFSTMKKADVLKPEETIPAETSLKEMAPDENKRIEFIRENEEVKETIAEVSQTIDTSQKQKSAPAKKSEDKKKTKIKKVIDKFKDDRQYIYESLAEKTSLENISSKLQSKPISDISSSIGINDKFKLTRDLFNNDTEAFNKTIEILNNASNFNEAFNFINMNFSWDMEDESVQFILDLVRRKFIVEKNE